MSTAGSSSPEATRIGSGDANEAIKPGLWWLCPSVIVGLVIPPGLLLALSLDDRVFRLAWRTPKWLDVPTVTLFLAGVAVFMTAALLPLFGGHRTARADWPSFADTTNSRLRKAAAWLFAITLFGYAVLGASGVRNGVTPQDLLATVLTGDNYSGDLKAAFETIPGASTLTQVGVAFTIVATVLLLRDRRDRVIAVQLGIVTVLALGRAYFLTERLALLELVVPVIALVSLALNRRGSRWVRRAVKAGPALLLPVVLIIFGVFEYSRSWTYFSARGGDFFEFIVQRFAGYYITAYNNGQMAMIFERTDGALPYRTVEAFWTAPGIEQSGLFERLSGAVPHPSFDYLLTVHANPEFNSNCGLCDPFVDWGPLPGLVFLAALGLIMGVAYRGFTDGQLGWVLVYPLFVTGLFEMPRYLYWATGRFVPALLALAIVAWWVGRTGSQRAVPPTTAPVEPVVSMRGATP